ncbi:hypothetical protein LNQ52_20485 [Klebsiella pneumoniae subsp. pneumoniae]|nr:hypothetical protein [Klebsiella pneumoniae subsp. pneumoniae]
MLLRIHTLCGKGVRGNFGTITIALTLMWVLFTLDAVALLAGDPHAMVRNMSVLQTSLEWQALARCLDSPAQSRGAV